jgi:hypothetical protein
MPLQESRRLFPDAPQVFRHSAERPRAPETLFDLIARHRQLRGVALPESQARTGLTYLALLVLSLAAWLAIGYAIFLIVSAAA